MIDSLIIYEFSRKLLQPKAVQGKWVSTGFEKEIGFRTKLEVPSVIENAVNNHWFRINDNYPPTEGEIALIAREIEQYAVLAVVTRLLDDSDRPLAGYRYFWLEKPPGSEIDGVGTLIKWWVEHDRPRFELKPHQEIGNTLKKNRNSNFYNAVPDQQDSFEEYHHQVEDIIPQIKHTPHIFTIQEKFDNSQQVPNYFELHYLALYLKQNYHRRIAWAWNVTLLENPDQFILICCAAEKYCELNSKDSKNKTSLNQSTTSQTPEKTPTLTSTIATKNLKEALKRIVESKQLDSQFPILVEELKKSNSTDWDWGQLIDETWLRNQSKNEVEVKYRALILLLNPNLQLTNFKNTPSDWINSIKAHQELEQPRRRKLLFFLPQKPEQITFVNQSAKEAVELQSKLLNYCSSKAIAAQLKPRIYEIISQLLLSLRTKYSTSNENFKSTEWLLCDSSEIWKSYLADYAGDLFNKLDKVYKQKQELNEDKTIKKLLRELFHFCQNYIAAYAQDLYLVKYIQSILDEINKNTKQKQALSDDKTDDFIKKVIEDLKFWEENPKKAKSSLQNTGIKNQSNSYSTYNSSPSSSQSQSLSSYQQIAQILEKIKAYPIAAFFYQLSTGEVPESVSKNSPNLPEIIPLNLKKKELEGIDLNSPKSHRTINFKFIPWIVLGAFVGTGLGIGLGSWLKLGDKLLYSSISKNKSEIIKPDPVRELYLYLNLLETGDKREDIQDKNSKNLDNLTKQIMQPNDSKFKTEKERQEVLKQRKTLIKSPLYIFIQQLTPIVRNQLTQNYQANQINANPPLESLEIEQAKEILQPLGIYRGEINTTWDKETSEAIKEFQTQYEINPAEGALGDTTWSVLSVMIQDQQVNQAAEKLQKIIQESKDYQELQAKYEKLKQCKTSKNQTYSICLEDIFK